MQDTKKMPEKLILKSVKAKPFTSDEGEQVQYFWYRVYRVKNETTIQAGCRKGDLPLNVETELELEKNENGKWKILVED